MKKFFKIVILMLAMLFMVACSNEKNECKHPNTIDIQAVDATCTQPGKTAGKKCATCDAVIEEQTEISARGHSEIEIASISPTCTEAGASAGEKCSVCNTVITAPKIIPAKGHTDANEDRKCDDCSTEINCDHLNKVDVPMTEATCTDKGKTEGVKCSDCGTFTVPQKDIPAKGHSEQSVAGTDPTCTAPGLTSGKICTSCGEVTSKQEEIKAVGHNDADNNGICDICNAETNSAESEKSYRVRLVVPAGIKIISENQLTVREGDDAVFRLSFDSNMAFRSLSEGDFDFDEKTVTLKNVKSNTTVELTAENVGYDTTVKYEFRLYGLGSDTSTVGLNSTVYAGTQIKITAGDPYRIFKGWSLGNYLSDGGTFLSEDRDMTLELSPYITDNGSVNVYSNYESDNVFYYDPNGGSVNLSSQNASNTEYYTVTSESNKLRVALDSDYYERVGCAALFWDDNTFTREGYVLTEYNTKSDGSGDGYSLGSKFPMINSSRTLYCIWSKDTDHADFTYESVTYSIPDGVSSKNVPHWKSEGIKITKYNGEDETVVIPEMIDGKYVTAIGTGAFNGLGIKNLVLSKYMLYVEDNAFIGCENLSKIYYPDSIYDINNEALDSASYTNFKKLYVNATMAPRFQSSDGAFWLKFARFISNSDKPRIAVIAGSSAYQGLSSEYLEALLGNDYAVVNFGTTRTTQGYMYLEAMQYYANENDIILYAPENSIFMLGEPTLYWKTIRDAEGMYNIFRHIDISGYDNVFGAFCEFNQGSKPGTVTQNFTNARYKLSGGTYEQAIKRTDINEYGEYQNTKRESYCTDVGYQDVYKITLNDRVKSILEGNFALADPNEDYNTSEKWCSITDNEFVENMNRAINAARSSGAKVYFSFCPVDADKVCDEALDDINSWLASYDALIEEIYDFDGNLGSSGNYIYNHKYFYDNAFHLNDYGRTVRTYTLYKDLCKILDIQVLDMRAVGTKFEGCIFEEGNSNAPIYGVDYFN